MAGMASLDQLQRVDGVHDRRRGIDFTFAGEHKSGKEAGGHVANTARRRDRENRSAPSPCLGWCKVVTRLAARLVPAMDGCDPLSVLCPHTIPASHHSERLLRVLATPTSTPPVD